MTREEGDLGKPLSGKGASAEAYTKRLCRLLGTHIYTQHMPLTAIITECLRLQLLGSSSEKGLSSSFGCIVSPRLHSLSQLPIVYVWVVMGVGESLDSNSASVLSHLCVLCPDFMSFTVDYDLESSLPTD